MLCYTTGRVILIYSKRYCNSSDDIIATSSRVRFNIISVCNVWFIVVVLPCVYVHIIGYNWGVVKWGCASFCSGTLRLTVEWLCVTILDYNKMRPL